MLLATLAAALLALGLFALAGCAENGGASSSSEAQEEDKTIIVAASPTPHAEILNDVVAPLLQEQGYTLEVNEFSDYVLPNTYTEEGEVDANFFQHAPYLENFNEENGTNLVSVAEVHVEPMSIYAGKTANLDDLADGAQVALPNDVTNEARALLLLEDAGLIELDEDAGMTATLGDIVSNPLNLQFVEVEASTIPDLLGNVDIAVVNTNYALGAKLDESLILKTENVSSPYVNVLVVQEGNEDAEKTQALVEALTSQEVADYITEHYDGAVIPLN